MSISLGDGGGITPVGGLYLVGANVAAVYDGLHHSVVIYGREYDTGGLVIGPVYGNVIGPSPKAMLSQSAAQAAIQFPNALQAAAAVQAQQGGAGTIGGTPE